MTSKIVAGLERLSQVFRTLLWEQAKKHQLSPIQIQLLIFIHYHSDDSNNVSYLAQEFSVTKPTISDAVKVLEQKGLIAKISSASDSRRYSIRLTPNGKTVVATTENYAAPFEEWIAQTTHAAQESLWNDISGMIRALNKIGVISVQRSCYTCGNYTEENGMPFCRLLNERLATKDIRTDCPEHEVAA